MQERDDAAKRIGAWLTVHFSEAAIALYFKIEWINCHEHAIVNTTEDMSKEGLTIVKEEIGSARLLELASIQSGKTYNAQTVKFRTGACLPHAPQMQLRAHNVPRISPEAIFSRPTATTAHYLPFLQVCG